MISYSNHAGWRWCITIEIGDLTRKRNGEKGIARPQAADLLILQVLAKCVRSSMRKTRQCRRIVVQV